MAKTPRHNPIVIRPGTTVGNLAAESDEDFLRECFYHHPVVNDLVDPKARKMVLAGRTGSGKSALLLHIKEKHTPNFEVDLFDMSLSYVANSDIIRFLDSIQVDLDLFFQSLWKHVLCIEYIRLRYKVDGESRSKSVFAQLRDLFGLDERKKRALEYLQDWQGKFWVTMDENIKEVTRKFEDRVESELGGDLRAVRARAGNVNNLTLEERSELTSRAKKVVNAEQLTDLSKVLDLLSDMSDYTADKLHFILIDKLDENWVDESIRFRMIRALIECLRSFRRVENLKVIVALRVDVVERVIQETRGVGFQREKYEDYFERIKWSKAQLRELLEKRIRYLFKRKYTLDHVSFIHVFPSKVGSTDAFDYICERTLMRPRDLLAFVNLALAKAEGRSEVTPKAIRDAELEFSRIRLQALEQEWESAFPTLGTVVRFLSGGPASIEYEEISSKGFIDEVAVRILQVSGAGHDPMFQACQTYLECPGQTIGTEIPRLLVAQLYRFGAAGIKRRPDERFLWSHLDEPIIDPSALDEKVRIRIHPMLHRVLNINENR